VGSALLDAARLARRPADASMAGNGAPPGLSPEEEARREEALMLSGPLSVLTHAVKSNEPVLINCRNNKKLLGRVKAFDRHCNMVLENVQELWTETVRNAKGKKRTKPMDRFISKMFLRGDSVILVVRNPA
jgi:small nuclear ribonucleoprotein D2